MPADGVTAFQSTGDCKIIKKSGQCIDFRTFLLYSKDLTARQLPDHQHPEDLPGH